MINRMQYPEHEAIAAAATGNPDAIACLVMNRYRNYLEAIVRRHYPSANDEFIREQLNAFCLHLLTPAKNGAPRLRNLNAGGQPRSYVAHTLENFLNDAHAREARNPCLSAEFDENRAPDSDCPDTLNETIERLNRREAEIKVLLDVLRDSTAMSARDRYILYTFLIGERFANEGRPLKLREKLAEQLGLPPSTVYNAYARALRRLQAEARTRLDQILDENS